MWDRPGWPQPETEPKREISHNLFYANAMKRTPGDHPVRAAPLFVRPPARPEDPADFQLRKESPARDAGTGGKKDIGAYEYGVKPWRAGIKAE